MQELITRAKELLANGTVARVLGWKIGDMPYNPEPAFFETVESLDKFVYNGFCGANLSKYMIEAGKKEGKTLVFMATDLLQAENHLLVEVDNSVNDRVYPQKADFTFYGGIYRDVNLIAVSASHFDLEYYGGPGIKVTPIVEGSAANVEVEVWTKNADGKTLTLISDDEDSMKCVYEACTIPDEVRNEAVNGTRSVEVVPFL